MNLANTARRTLIRFGKVCPFIICFTVLVSDVENIYAILSQDIIFYGDTPVYNTPISFAIANIEEYDILVVFVMGLISLSIEACVYNITAVLYLGILLYRNHLFAVNEPYNDTMYLVTMFLCSGISFYYVYKGIKILTSK